MHIFTESVGSGKPRWTKFATENYDMYVIGNLVVCVVSRGWVDWHWLHGIIHSQIMGADGLAPFRATTAMLFTMLYRINSVPAR